MQTIPILTYHSLDTSGSIVSVPPQTFRDHLECIADAGFSAISLSAAVSHRQKNQSWPERSVVLTFDDGFANVHNVALPALERHRFTATVFVISAFMGRDNAWAPPPAGLGTQPILTWSQAAELVDAGFEIGSHTKTHPDLRQCSQEEIEEQLSASRWEIEDRIGLPVQSFAYPYGETSTLICKYAAREFRSACTTVLKQANGESLHCLPRVDAFYLLSPSNLRRLLAGQLDTYLAIRRLGRTARRALRIGFRKPY